VLRLKQDDLAVNMYQDAHIPHELIEADGKQANKCMWVGLCVGVCVWSCVCRRVCVRDYTELTTQNKNKADTCTQFSEYSCERLYSLSSVVTTSV
jgi:hypothetical protein